MAAIATQHNAHPDIIRLYEAARVYGDSQSLFQFFRSYNSLHSDQDPHGRVAAAFILHLRKDFNIYGLEVVSDYLEQPLVRQRCFGGDPPTTVEEFLQSKSPADRRLRTCAEQGDASGVAAAYSEGGANYRAGWYRQETPAHIAARAGDNLVLQVILQHEPASGCQVSVTGMMRTSLHLAIARGHESAVRLILGYNPNLEVEDGYGHTPLRLAISRMLPAGQWKDGAAYLLGLLRANNGILLYDPLPPIALLLLNAGADIDTPRTEDGLTVLHLACLNGLVTVVSHFVLSGADINARSHDGFTPLHCAVLALHRELVDVLLSEGALLKVPNSLGRTAWSTAFAAAPGADDNHTAKFLLRKSNCLGVIEACQDTKDMAPDDAITQFECGTWLGGMYPFSICSRYLRKATRAALIEWALSDKKDASALHAALYGGSGADRHGQLARLRYLGGPTGGHHGLRPIRARIASYLVRGASVRSMVHDCLSEGWEVQGRPYKHRKPDLGATALVEKEIAFSV